MTGTPLGDILALILDDVLSPERPSSRRLFWRSGSADHRRAEMLDPLHQQLPGASRRSMDQHRHPRLHPCGTLDQIFGGATLEHDRRGDLI
jgi:hypothetical protein